MLEAVQRGKRFSVQSGTVAQAWFHSGKVVDVEFMFDCVAGSGCNNSCIVWSADV